MTNRREQGSLIPDTLHLRRNGNLTTLLDFPAFSYDQTILLIRNTFAEGKFDGDPTVESVFIQVHGTLLRWMCDGGVMSTSGLLVPQEQIEPRDTFPPPVFPVDGVYEQGTHHQLHMWHEIQIFADQAKLTLYSPQARFTVLVPRAIERMELGEYGRCYFYHQTSGTYILVPGIDQIAENMAKGIYERMNVNKPYPLAPSSVGKLAYRSVLFQFGGRPQKDLTYSDIYGKPT